MVGAPDGFLLLQKFQLFSGSHSVHHNDQQNLQEVLECGQDPSIPPSTPRPDSKETTGGKSGACGHAALSSKLGLG